MGVNDSPPTAGHRHDLFAATYIRAFLDGSSPNGTPPEAFGEYRDIIEALVLAHSHGATPKVREAFGEIIRRYPAITGLLSGDPAAAEGWRVYTLADAYQPRPPLPYVVDGLFPLPSVSIVYGAPGTLKSLLLADLALCVAAGLPWLPPLPGTRVTAKATIQVQVLWCDFDNGIRLTHERFARAGQGQKSIDNYTPLLRVDAFILVRCWEGGCDDSLGAVHCGPRGEAGMHR